MLKISNFTKDGLSEERWGYKVREERTILTGMGGVVA